MSEQSILNPRRLGRTGIEVTAVGLGCMQFSGGGMVGRHMFPVIGQLVVDEVVGAALAAGVSWFDTAEMYGRGASERALTTALRAHDAGAGDVLIATKWTPLLRTAASITRTVDARLAALQGYPIALHQIHMPRGSLSSLRAQLDALADLCDAGRIRAVGVSNFSAAQLKLAHAHLAARGIALAANQVQISLLHRSIERDGTLAAARQLGVTLIGSSPLRSGVLTGKFHDQPELAAATPRLRRTLAGLSRRGLARTAPVIRELRRIGAAHGVSPATVAVCWVISFYGDGVVAIPGASRPSQAEQSAAAMCLRLTDPELTRLAEVARPG